MKQISAVEWLVERLKENGVNFWQEEIEMVEEAKEMEKEQIMKAHMDGALNTIWDENTDRDENASDYYYETYYKER